MQIEQATCQQHDPTATSNIDDDAYRWGCIGSVPVLIRGITRVIEPRDD